MLETTASAEFSDPSDRVWPPLLSLPDTVLREVATHFDSRTFERGLAYARQGRVNLVKVDWPVVAQVSGTTAYVVTVYHALNRYLSGDCSCPVGVDCKHAVAAALVALAGGAELAVKLQRARAEAVVGEWLSEFSVLTDSTPERGDSPGIVAYVIDQVDETMGITVHRSARLKRGGYSKSSVITSLGDPTRGYPMWADVEDIRRISMLRAVTHASFLQTTMKLSGVPGALLKDLADGGHLFWREVSGMSLCYGPERKQTLCWRAGEGDGHTIGIDGEQILVPCQEPHYIDLKNALIGPLDLGVPGALVSRLVMGPPIPKSMLPTVEVSLGPLLGAAVSSGLFAIEGGRGGTQEVVAVQPHVFVCIADNEIEARATAVYGEHRYPMGEWQAGLGATRNMVEESRLLSRLDDLRTDYRPAGGTPTQELLGEARHVALEVIPTLRDEGWSCELSEDFPSDPPLVAEMWVEELKPRSDTNHWFSLELGVVVGGRTVPLLPILLEAIRSGELPLEAQLLESDVIAGINLRLPDGELVHVSGERLQRWLRPLIELRLRGLSEEAELVLPGFAAAHLAENSPGQFSESKALASARKNVDRLLSLEPRREGKGFAGALRPYQRQGLAWLRFLHDAGYGGLLCDDMGLGKTVQILAFLDGLRTGRVLKNNAPALIVAPRSVVGHWHDEAVRFAPKLRPVVHLGPQRATSRGDLLGAPMIVTSYQTLHRDMALFSDVSWTTVIFDEAQALKNPSTKLRRAMSSLLATSRFCVTGTPIENHLGELWSQVDLVMPGLLGRKTTFDAVFRRPIEKYGDPRALDFLRQRIRPFLLRRTKESVDVDLPDKTEVVERVNLGAAQRDLYESLRLSLDEDVRRALKDKGLRGSSLVVLDALLKLRQCCCHPRLIQTKEAQKIKTSAKLERLMSMLEELADAGRFTLVFSQFTSMLELIEEQCRKSEISYRKLTGSTRNREHVIRSFQDGEASVFLISLKAGGTGLNLTRADTVIHYDPWWNPATEDQATDRAHRIGQDKNVFVYRLVASGTLEERIAHLQDEKRSLTHAALRQGGATHLAATDLAALYRQLV